MKFLLIPYRRLTFNSRLSVERTTQLLHESVTPTPLIYFDFRWWAKPPRPFEGTVTPSGFTIIRAIRYRNSFLPYLNGRFTPTPTGTAITVDMTIHPLTGIVVLLMIMGAGPLLLSTLTVQFDLRIVLIALAVYLVAMLAFSYEANRAEALLRQILAPYFIYTSVDQ